MPDSAPIQPTDIALDAQAIDAFVREIVAVVDHTALGLLYDSDGNILWQQRYQDGAPDPVQCVSRDVQGLCAPQKRDLGNGNHVFEFPINSANIGLCVFSIVVFSLDPPSLSAVSLPASKMLECIKRQIDVDATLSTVTISALSFDTPDLVKQLELQPENNSLQRVVDLCFAHGGIDCAAATISAEGKMALRNKESFDASKINDIIAKLRGPLEKKRKIINAPIILADGSKSRIVCAPILSQQQSIDGLALLISPIADQTHSKLIRILANKIAKMQSSKLPEPKLLNRGQLVMRIKNAVQSQPASVHSLMYFDNDKMHTINDAFGYSGGDRALTTFRRILLGSVGKKDAVAHLGGDRFGVFLSGASADTAIEKACQILQFLSQESIDDGSKAIGLSASAGVVDTTSAKNGADDMLILAEVASRSAQERGGNQATIFQDLDSSIIQRRSDVDKVGFLQMAMLNDQFVLHAQRIEPMNAEPGQKFEILARLEEEGGTSTSPAQFLSAAERYQLMSALDRWVINSALTSIAASDNTLEINLATFCINVSAQSLQDDGFIDFIEAKIAETNVSADTLCFEITETSLVRHIDKAQRFVHRMQSLGAMVALDDFGTGYSSFAYLKTLPVNFLKIDGSFVRDLLENDLSKTIVQSVVNIADVIGAETVAEHVENGRVQEWLRRAGVHFIQGYVVHKPEPFTDVLRQLDVFNGAFDNEFDSIDLRAEDLSMRDGTNLG